jgi:hypothetical protein
VASLQDSNYLAFDVDVAVRGGYAYVADQSSGLGRLTVVDVHTPSAPRIVGSLTNSTWLNGAYRVRLRGTFAYVSAAYAHALAAVNISDPAHPRLAGGYSSSSNLNRTTGLDVDPSGRFLIGTSPYLSTQSPSPYPPYPLHPGGPTVTGTVSVVDLDPTLRPVPNVLGKRLKAAKQAIKAAGFRVGKITFRFSAKAKKGRVIFQKPKPGKHLKRAARVNMVVSKGRRETATETDRLWRAVSTA